MMDSTISLPTPPESVRAETPSTYHGQSIEKKWWNTNMPESQWTQNCPDFLEGQVEKNIGIMSMRDEDHPRLTWDEVKILIETNRIGQFHRMPSDLRRYIKYCYDLKQQYGSVLYFIQNQRLKWPTIHASGDAPFTNETDYKILYNDWPYSIDTDITHIVVWTKFVLEDDPETGFLKEENRLLVEEFVLQTFCHSPLGHAIIDRNHLRWFKNWRSLRSVHALEHFHVMLYKAPAELIEKVTQGDRPMCEEFESTL